MKTDYKDKGLLLLRKGQKGMIHAVFSRFGLTLVLLVECATYLYGVDCIRDMERDFQDTLLKCRRVTPETARREKWTVKLTGRLMKVIAPLM